MPIPVPRPGPVQPGAINIAGSIGAATMDAEALSDLGYSVQGLGERLNQFALKRQDAINKTQEIEELSSWAELETNLQQHFLTEQPDETQWLPETESALGEGYDATFSKELAPELRDRLEERWLEFSARTKIRVGGQAMTRSIERAKGRVDIAVERFRRAGDLEGAYEALDTLESVGVLPEDIEKAKMQVQEQVAEDSIEEALQMDPIGMERALEEGQYKDQMSPRKFRYIQEEARVAANRARSEIFSQLTLDMIDGIYQSPEAIDQMAEDGVLTKGQALAYRREYEAKVPSKASVQLFNALYAEALRYSPGTDKDMSELTDIAGRIAFSGLPPARLTDLKKVLDQRVNSVEDQEKMKAGMLRDQLQREFENGKFGIVPEVEIGGEMVKDPILFERAHAAYDDLRVEMEQWIDAKQYEDLLEDGRAWLQDRIGGEMLPATGAERILEMLPDAPYVPRGTRPSPQDHNELPVEPAEPSTQLFQYGGPRD